MNDEWDEQAIGDKLELKERTIKIKKFGKNMRRNYDIYYQTAYLKRICSKNGIYKWKFKILSWSNRINSNWNFIIGIWKIGSSDKRTMGDIFATKKENSYAFVSSASYLVDPKKTGWYLKSKKYGFKCNEGDIIEMILDLNEATLEYTVNNKKCGIAFKVSKQYDYMAAVSLYTGTNSSTGTAIELL